jgi:hypothetical protein
MRVDRRALLAGIVVGLAGALAAGCGSKSASQVAPGSSSANLTVTNSSPVTVDVYVDYARVGEVQPGLTGFFRVTAGVRTLHLRERGESHYHWQGDFSFGASSIVDLTYWPGHSRNFVVANEDLVTLHVYVDLIEVAEVRPGERRDLYVSPGRRDVHLRPRGDSGLTFAGTFDFPAAGSGLPEVTVFWRP